MIKLTCWSIVLTLLPGLDLKIILQIAARVGLKANIFDFCIPDRNLQYIVLRNCAIGLLS